MANPPVKRGDHCYMTYPALDKTDEHVVVVVMVVHCIINQQSCFLIQICFNIHNPWFYENFLREMKTKYSTYTL